MGSCDYWVTLAYGGTVLGAGMVVQRGGVVLTAKHCLRSLPAGVNDLDVLFPDGRREPARVEERVDWDLALVALHDPDKCDVAPPQTGVCLPEQRWSAPYRPGPSDPSLSGSVDTVHADYVLTEGVKISAAQLRVDQGFGNYQGYSGGPVQSHGEPDLQLLGVLLEQYPDQVTPNRNANVLFAATIREALQRFRRFDVAHLFPFLLSSAPAHSESAAERRPRSRWRRRSADEVREATEAADVQLSQIQKWRDAEIIRPQYAQALELRVLREWLDDPEFEAGDDR